MDSRQSRAPVPRTGSRGHSKERRKAGESRRPKVAGCDGEFPQLLSVGFLRGISVVKDFLGDVRAQRDGDELAEAGDWY